MKTSSLTYPPHHFIDLSPLAARYSVLTQAVLTFIAAGRFGEVLRQSHKLTRLVRVYARLDRQNKLWARKLEMLTDRPWRECVLKELGGIRRLRLWEAAQRRIEQRILARGDKPKKETEPTEAFEPSWLYTPERIAESERLKAYVRKCARAVAAKQPNVFRDRVKMDFDGLFRLPPLPRIRARGAQVKVYTKNSIVDYTFTGMPFWEEAGLGPATVWPAEFYAAMELDDKDILSSVIPRKPLAAQTGDQTGDDSTLTLDLPSSAFGLVRDDRNIVPIHLAIPPATYRDLFENPV